MPTTTVNTTNASGSAKSCPPKLTTRGSSHGDSLTRRISARPAGNVESAPSANVTATSHTGSGCARSKRRMKTSHAIDRRIGTTKHAVARAVFGGSPTAPSRRRGGRRGVVRICFSSCARAYASIPLPNDRWAASSSKAAWPSEVRPRTSTSLALVPRAAIERTYAAASVPSAGEPLAARSRSVPLSPQPTMMPSPSSPSVRAQTLRVR